MTDRSPIAISIQNVSKSYRLVHDRANSLKEVVVRRNRRRAVEYFQALDDVSLDVERGGFLGLIGHNGSGKSTLLKIVAGIHRATSGRVDVDGRVSALLELGSGFHPELTGRENIYLNGAILGMSRKTMDAAVDDIVEFSGLGDFVDRPVKVYSSGMYVRLGFAVAVHVDPEILLVDEVIAVGDEDFQRRCLEHMFQLRRKGVTIVLVSHSIPLVQSLCDRVAWLDHGRIVMAGEPNDVCRAYLDRVNAVEAERLSHTESEGSTVESVPRASGRGSGELSLFHVDLLDTHWQARPVATSGDPLVIRLWFEATDSVTDPVFGMEIHHVGGTLVTGPSTAAQALSTGEVQAGRGYVDVVFDRLLLMPGEYELSFTIHDKDQLRCFHATHREHVLRVQPGSSLESRGLIESGGRWEPPVAHQRGEPGHPNVG